MPAYLPARLSARLPPRPHTCGRRFESLLLCGTAQGWQMALGTLGRRPLVCGAMLLGQLPGLHRLATWALLHSIFSDTWLSQPARPAASAGGKSQVSVLLAGAGASRLPHNLLQAGS